MCVICVDIQKGKLNRIEARRNLAEMVISGIPALHFQEVMNRIDELEYVEEQDQDAPDTDRMD